LLLPWRLRKTVEEMVVTGPNGPFKVTSSFGVASLYGPGRAGTMQELIARADTAMHAAKHGGRRRARAQRSRIRNRVVTAET